MGASRVSNRDVLDAISAQSAAIDRLVNALTASAMPTEQPAAEPEVPVLVPESQPSAEKPTIKVDGAYLNHMVEKAAAHATAKGEDVVLYGRRNKSGQTKLAYALLGRYQTQIRKQQSCLGAVRRFSPAS